MAKKTSCGPCGGKKKPKATLQKVKKGKKKSCKKPRKVRNAFLEFRKGVQARLRAKDPCISMPEVSKRAGYCWGKLPEEIKDTYRKKVCGEEKRKSPSACYCPTCKRMLPKKRKGSKE